LEVGRQLNLGEVLIIFRFGEELPFVHAVVRGLLPAQRTHRAQASHLLHCEPPFELSSVGVKVSQIEMTSDSPFDRSMMTAQSSDFFFLRCVGSNGVEHLLEIIADTNDTRVPDVARSWRPNAAAK
jgi:hypothetical protein